MSGTDTSRFLETFQRGFAGVTKAGVIPILAGVLVLIPSALIIGWPAVVIYFIVMMALLSLFLWLVNRAMSDDRADARSGRGGAS